MQPKYQTLLLILILLFALGTRLFNLGNPPTYYFDEVYHAVTAKAYARNDPAGYEWWHDAPEPGTAYEWLHPPIAKLLMAVGWKYLGQTAWAWRFPGALFGVGVVLLVYFVTVGLFDNQNIGLLAAFLASLDGLLLSQSRIGMNDIYVAWFMVAAIGSYFMSRKYLDQQPKLSQRWLWASGVLTGLAMSTKWTGVYVLGMVGTWELLLWWKLGAAWWKRVPRLLVIFLVVPILVYLASYGQFWLQGHTWSQFVELHQQIWWYQTHLQATHTYESKAWEWPLMIRPVWYYVNYGDNGMISNIYNLANPVLGWFGLIALIDLVFRIPYRTFRKSTALNPIFTIVIAYVWSWMPWFLSPRIMFFYHYTPAIPWLCIGLAYLLSLWWKEYEHGKIVAIGCVALIFITFVWLSPMWLNIPLPEKWWPYLFWLPSWK